MTGMPVVNAVDVDRALIPDMRKRAPLAHQLDLFYRLAVRMVLEGSAAATVIEQSDDRRSQLETVLMVPHACWVNLGHTSLEIWPLARVATAKLAPALLDAPDQIDKVFDELADLLADIDGYYGRLDALRWSARYDPIGRKFQPHDPLLTRVAGTWQFLYDRTGRWLRPEQESQKVGYGGADWKRNAEFVRDVKAAIEQFAQWTSREAPPLLTVLSTELHILETSPPWSATEPALARLEQYKASRTPYSEFKDDVDSVGAYAKMLAANQVSLTLALVSAAVAGRFVPNVENNRAASVDTGLRAISHVFGFSDPTRPSPMVEARMIALAKAIAERWTALGSHFTKLQYLLNDRDQNEWAAALQTAGDAIGQSVTFSEDERRATIQRAWDQWRESVLKAEPEAPSLDAVLCRAADIGPDRQAAETRSLTEWSTLYCRAILQKSIDDRGFTPYWLGAIAAARLLPSLSFGAEPGIARIFPVRLTDEELQNVRQVFSGGTRHGSRLSGLIVYRNPSVMTWRVSTEYGAVAWTPEQASESLERLRASNAPGPLGTAMDHVFIETGIADQAANAVIDLLKSFQPDDPDALSVTAFTFDRATEKPTWADRLITQPEDVEGLMRTAVAVPVSGGDALPIQTRLLWDLGGRLTGTLDESPSGGHANLEVELSPDPPEVKLAWATAGQRHIAWLSFRDGLVIRTGVVTRVFTLLYDGVTVRAEQQSAYFLRFNNFIGRLVTRLADELSLEFKEETRGWVVDLRRRRRRGSVPERRTRMRLFTLTTNPVT